MSTSEVSVPRRGFIVFLREHVSDGKCAGFFSSVSVPRRGFIVFLHEKGPLIQSLLRKVSVPRRGFIVFLQVMRLGAEGWAARAKFQSPEESVAEFHVEAAAG